MRLWIALAGLLFTAWPTVAAGQTRLFSSDAPLEITVEAPLATLVRNAPRSTDAHPATLRLATPGAPAVFQIRVSARGLTRRTGDACSFPPLRLDFRGAARRGTLFQGQGRVKLVTHCRPQTPYEERVALEYLAYRFYNALTPQSFRVRSAQITYRDTEGRRPEETRFGFLIEDIDDAARRNRRAEREIAAVSPEQLDAAASARFALFQYMIGNLDWSLLRGPPGESCCHNSKLVAASGGAIVPVPYDFDYSGFVDAPYAVPPDSIQVRSVRTRVYRGLCRHNTELPAAAAGFRARRGDMMALITGEARLSESRRRNAQRYIEDFFAILDDPERFERAVTRNCRERN